MLGGTLDLIANGNPYDGPMTEFAPYPWRAEGWESTIINDRHGNTICMMPSAHLGLRKVKATARLIAAAPSLFNACLTAIRVMESEPECAVYKSHLEIIKSAIAMVGCENAQVPK